MESCYECTKEKELRCFLRKHLSALLHTATTPRTEKVTTNSKGSLSVAGIDNHFWPQAWNCGLENYIENYAIFYYGHPKFRDQLRSTFKQLDYKEAEMLEPNSTNYRFFADSKSHHRTNASALLEQLRSDCDLLNLAFRATVTDYLALRLSVPEIIVEACSNRCRAERYEMCQYA